MGFHQLQTQAFREMRKIAGHCQGRGREYPGAGLASHQVTQLPRGIKRRQVRGKTPGIRLDPAQIGEPLPIGNARGRARHGRGALAAAAESGAGLTAVGKQSAQGLEILGDGHQRLRQRQWSIRHGHRFSIAAARGTRLAHRQAQGCQGPLHRLAPDARLGSLHGHVPGKIIDLAGS